MRRSLGGPFVQGLFHNRSSAEPMRRGAFVQGPFVQEGGGVYGANTEGLRPTFLTVLRIVISFRNPRIFFESCLKLMREVIRG